MHSKCDQLRSGELLKKKNEATEARTGEDAGRRAQPTKSSGREGEEAERDAVSIRYAQTTDKKIGERVELADRQTG